jgi:methanogenic corrinoid protein MtbC1
MNLESTVEQLFHLLVSGDRRRVQAFVATLGERGIPAERLANDVYWPVHEMLVKLFKHAQISRLSYNYATRALRQVAHQGAAAYVRSDTTRGRVLMMCGPTEGEELGAQIAVDLLEAAGYEVFFGGAGVANDEVLAELTDTKPHTLVMWASAASDVAWRLPGMSSTVAPAARMATVFAGEVDSGAMMVALRPPAAA